MGELETAQEVYGKEVTNASWSFYVWKHINNVACNNAEVQKALSKNALCWRVITHSLQNTFLITLGRIFDNDGRSLTAERLLKMCITHINQFGGEALRDRKMAGVDGPEPGWLDEYVRAAYRPTEDDLGSLLSQVLEQKAIHNEFYTPIRHKVVAHRDWDTIARVDELFGKTNIGQIQEMLDLLFQIEKIVWDLLYNGKLNQVGDYKFDEEGRVREDVEAMLGRLMA